jgi:hypothetical protein
MLLPPDTVPTPRPRAGAWSLFGILAWVVTGPLVLMATSWVNQLAAPLGPYAEAGTAGWGVYLAVSVVAWGLATTVVAAVAAPRFGIRVSLATRGALAALVGGLALAALTTYALHEQVRLRMGWFDPDYAGWTLLAIPALVGLAIATWASTAIPRRDRTPLAVLGGAGALTFGLSAATNLPGLADGLRDESVPLAAVLLIDGAWVVAVVAAMTRGRREPSA